MSSILKVYSAENTISAKYIAYIIIKTDFSSKMLSFQNLKKKNEIFEKLKNVVM